VSPDLLEEIVAHVDALRRVGLPTDGGAYLFCNRRGGRLQRQRVNKIVREAATLASTHLDAHGLPELPNTTPHTLRRTYISVALLANRFDVLWVMRQVGHADSKMTMDVYAQLQQRAERSHGEAFDALVRRARERLYGTVEGADGEAKRGERSLEELVDDWRDDDDGRYPASE
jgi:integrase